MSSNKQANRPLTFDCPLGADTLLLRGLTGREGISKLFRFELDLIADNKAAVPFENLLGKKMTAHVALAAGGKRHFNGFCSRISQGARDPRLNNFTTYTVEIVPGFWLLTRTAQSRIFQRLSVPDILKKVLAPLTTSFEIQGTFEKRDYCVQYRETDFNFASRLMEEEGIYYYFKHTDGDHTMVLANTPSSHVDLPGPSALIFEGAGGGKRDEDRVFNWEKFQELRSGKYTLHDHSFEVPHKNLEAQKTIQDSVSIGSVSHKLKVGGNDKFEVYDYPGEYAQRFDGVDKGGGDQPAEIQKIFTDNKRTVEIRMQEEALPSLRIRGSSNVRQMVAGHKFTLQRHFNADGGPYVLTDVSHDASGAGEFRPGETGAFTYRNEFFCIPQTLPFRPPRVTPKPVVPGTQTAVVVGPPGEEIFVDKFARVKVQFHWDREGKMDPDSSCWIRVATHWAGKHWGFQHIPRINQEVVVDFLEGDPDQPIIVGSVYNADMLPTFDVPKNKTQSGIRSRSTLQGTPDNFNEFRFEDKKGKEQVFLHAERNQDIEVEADETHWVGHDRSKTIDHDETDHIKNDWTIKVDNNRDATIGANDTETVGRNQSIKIQSDQTQQVMGSQSETIMGNQTLTVGANRSATVTASDSLKVLGTRSAQVLGADSLTVAGAKSETVGAAHSMTIGGALTIQTAAAATITAGGATIVTAGGAITITAMGAIAITAGGAVTVTAAGAVAVTAPMITLTGIVMVGGILMTPLVIAGSVISPLYTPGLGNML